MVCPSGSVGLVRLRPGARRNAVRDAGIDALAGHSGSKPVLEIVEFRCEHPFFGPEPRGDLYQLGPFVARLGLCFHDEAALATLERIEREAEAFHAPVMPVMLRSALRQHEAVPGPELRGDLLVLSAVKPAEDGKGIVLRCYNPTARDVRGEWRSPKPARAASRCRLDETPLERQVPTRTSAIAFTAEARAVVTISVR